MAGNEAKAPTPEALEAAYQALLASDADGWHVTGALRLAGVGSVVVGRLLRHFGRFSFEYEDDPLLRASLWSAACEEVNRGKR